MFTKVYQVVAQNVLGDAKKTFFVYQKFYHPTHAAIEAAQMHAEKDGLVVIDVRRID